MYLRFLSIALIVALIFPTGLSAEDTTVGEREREQLKNDIQYASKTIKQIKEKMSKLNEA